MHPPFLGPSSAPLVLPINGPLFLPLLKLDNRSPVHRCSFYFSQDAACCSALFPPLPSSGRYALQYGPRSTTILELIPLCTSVFPSSSLWLQPGKSFDECMQQCTKTFEDVVFRPRAATPPSVQQQTPRHLLQRRYRKEAKKVDGEIGENPTPPPPSTRATTITSAESLGMHLREAGTMLRKSAASSLSDLFPGAPPRQAPGLLTPAQVGVSRSPTVLLHP